MAKEPESKKLPIQTAVARGISNSKRIKAIELSTSMIAKDVFAIKSLGGVGAGGKKDDDKNGNGKNGKGGSGKKDSTLTNTGFSEGVDDIKQGFANLGAGLGPLQVVVDFIKGIGTKLSALFGIFKGFGKILFSVPKGIMGLFGRNKKKDKKDAKRDKKNAKLSGKMVGLLGALKPALILGAILAIGTGLVLLYNWFVRLGIIDAIKELATNFQLGLIDLQIGIAKIFNKGEKLKMLEEEKAAIIIEKKVLPNLSEGDKKTLQTLGSPAAQANFLAGRAVTKGASESGAQDALERSSGSMRTAVDELVIGEDASGNEIKLNMGAVSATDTQAYKTDTQLKIKEMDLPKLVSDLNLGSSLRTEGDFRELDEGYIWTDTYGFRTIDNADGTPFTLYDLADQIKKKNPPEKDEPPLSDADAFALANEIISAAPGLAVRGEDSAIISTRGFVRNDIAPGAIKLTENDDGDMVEDMGMAMVLADFGLELGEDGMLKAIEKDEFIDYVPVIGHVRTLVQKGSDAERERLEGIYDDMASDFIDTRALDAEIAQNVARTQELTFDDVEDILDTNTITATGSLSGPLDDVSDEERLIDDLKFIQDFNEKYKDGVPGFGIAGVRLRNYRENLARAEIAVKNIKSISAADMSAAGISAGQQTVITNAATQIENKYGAPNADGGGFDYIKEHSIEPNYGGI